MGGWAGGVGEVGKVGRVGGDRTGDKRPAILIAACSCTTSGRGARPPPYPPPTPTPTTPHPPAWQAARHGGQPAAAPQAYARRPALPGGRARLCRGRDAAADPQHARGRAGLHRAVEVGARGAAGGGGGEGKAAPCEGKSGEGEAASAATIEQARTELKAWQASRACAGTALPPPPNTAPEWPNLLPLPPSSVLPCHRTLKSKP